MPPTSKLFIANRILCAPIEVLFTLLVFILSKNAGAQPFQLAIIACIKPISSLFAFYLNSVIFDNPHRIRPYILLNNTIGCLPCLFYPFIDNVWFYIGSYAIFMVTTRAVYPAWIEVLKSSMQIPALSKTVSQSASVFYCIEIVLPPAICFLMDREENLWRYLFMSFALLRMANMALIFCIKPNIRMPTVKPLLNPFKTGWALLNEKPAFAHYQILFFLGGAGIIGSQSILPIYFKDNLDLSYAQLGLAFSFCKGASFLLASPFWSKYAARISLYHLNCLVNGFSCLFFAFVLAANSGTNWLFLAYLFYGTMQAGCQMSWNLSGPFFSGPNESTIYSALNLAFVGIRGCICPFLGYLVFIHTSAGTVFTAAGLLCLIGIAYGLWADHRYRASDEPQPLAYPPLPTT